MGEDDLLTCRNQQNKTRHSPCTDEALMKQFNLFLAARGIVAIIHGRQILYTHRQKSNTYPQNIHTYNSQGELILNSRHTVAC